MKLNLTTRKYKNGDKSAVTELWRDCSMSKAWNDPAQEIAAIGNARQAQLFVGELNGRVVASAAAAFDGHRGWVYYMAVTPALQGQGIGRHMMVAAEAWLVDRGAGKVQLMIRPENGSARDFYAAIGYHAAPRTMMQKWLTEPPRQEFHELGDGMLTTTVSFLEMRDRPKGRHVQSPGGKLALIRAEPPTIAFYRHLFEVVGEAWFWWERRVLSDAELGKIIRDPQVEFYVLHVNGVPAGFSELDLRHRADDGVIEVAYLGLTPEFIGRGYGNYLMHWTIDAAWQHEPRVVTVNTCTLDHPHALSFYQRSGFNVVGHEQRTVIDPRLTGVIPPGTPLPSTYHAADVPEPGEPQGDNITPLPRHH